MASQVIDEIKKEKGIKLDLEMEAEDWKQVSDLSETEGLVSPINSLAKGRKEKKLRGGTVGEKMNLF